MSSKAYHKKYPSELRNLLQLCNSVALSYANVEGTFIKMQRIKSWLRPNMTANC